jgi:hypothetical protein
VMRDGVAPSRVATWGWWIDAARSSARRLRRCASRCRCRSMTAARLVARCVRGVEELLAEEVRRRGFGSGRVMGHREVRFAGRAGPAVLDLATADDVFVLAAEVEGIGRARADLDRLRCAVAGADVDRVRHVRELCGGPPGARTVDVSASVLGRRAFNRYDLEDAVGEVLARRLGLPYRSRRGGGRSSPRRNAQLARAKRETRQRRMRDSPRETRDSPERRESRL